MNNTSESQHSQLPQSQSTEELDELERSTKKITPDPVSSMETQETPDPANATPDLVMETQIDPKEIAQKSQPFDFKGALLNQKEQSKEDLERRIAAFADSDDEDDEMDSEEAPPTKSKIKITFSKEHLKRIRANWKGCLIIKLLGKNIGFRVLMEKIHKLWNPEGLITPIDVGLGFYIIRFESKSDYLRVYSGGPWIIQDHYLTVRKWHSNFKADMASAIKTAVWICLPLLPMEYSDEASIDQIAEKLGKPLKVDGKTLKGVRGSYARICVEMDLSKPLPSSVAVEIYDFLLEYEHIHLICFSCGRVGHRREHCSNSPVTEAKNGGDSLTVGESDASDKKTVGFNGQIREDEPKEIGYGEWMVVSRRPKKPNRTSGPARVESLQQQKQPDPSHYGSVKPQTNGPQNKKNPNPKAQETPHQSPNIIHNDKAPDTPSGSRFNILSEMQIDSASPQPDLVPSKIPKFKYQATHNGQRPSSSIVPQKNSSQKISLAPIKSTVHKHKGKDPLHGGSKSKPIFKPINFVSIDLNLANPIHTTNLTPPSPVQINPPISLSVHRSHNKKPPDPSTLPTLTYHEYARNAENAILSHHKMRVWLESGTEASHLVEATWWMEEMILKLKLCEPFPEGMDHHTAVLKPLQKQDRSKSRSKTFLVFSGTPVFQPPVYDLFQYPYLELQRSG